jgi:hypothetical protein
MSSTERVRVLEDLLVEWVLALDDLDICVGLSKDDVVTVDTGPLVAFVIYGQRARLAQLRALGIEPMAAIAWSP